MFMISSGKREAALKSAFTQEMKRQNPEFLMLLHTSRAAPDRSITGLGFTSFFEFKHGTPSFTSSGDQELMCMRLATAGFCRYVLWQERAGVKHTLIVHPNCMHARIGSQVTAEISTIGFNHAWLCQYIRMIHETYQG